jgi:hypothetical protein
VQQSKEEQRFKMKMIIRATHARVSISQANNCNDATILGRMKIQDEDDHESKPYNQEEIELLEQGSSSIRQEIRILRGEEEEEEPGRKGAGRGFAPSGCCCC